jgi:hypothetical protein
MSTDRCGSVNTALSHRYSHQFWHSRGSTCSCRCAAANLPTASTSAPPPLLRPRHAELARHRAGAGRRQRGAPGAAHRAAGETHGLRGAGGCGRGSCAPRRRACRECECDEGEGGTDIAQISARATPCVWGASEAAVGVEAVAAAADKAIATAPAPAAQAQAWTATSSDSSGSDRRVLLKVSGSARFCPNQITYLTTCIQTYTYVPLSYRADCW